jgi:hypothetical protein
MDGQRPRRSRAWRLSGALAGASLAAIALAMPASASSHEFEIGIAVAPGQTCDEGSDALGVGSAQDFLVEVCVTENGEPATDYPVYLSVEHPDGSVDRYEAVTDSNGNASFPVTAKLAGDTVATICDDSGCQDSVKLSANEDPAPPEDPYVPSGADVGPSAAITDPAADMGDGESGGSAGPEVSSAFDGLDIQEIRYAGVINGAATFKITMVGNGEAFVDSDPESWDIGINVTPSDGPGFSMAAFLVRDDSGETSLETRAFGGGEELPNKPVVEWEDENTLCLSLVGVDVPEGSSLVVFTGSSSSGISRVFDEAGGTIVAGPAEEGEDGDTDAGSEEDDGDDSDDEADEGGTTGESTGGGSGGTLAAIVGGILAALGLGSWWKRRQSDEDDIPWHIARPGKPISSGDGGDDSPPLIGLRGAPWS